VIKFDNKQAESSFKLLKHTRSDWVIEMVTQSVKRLCLPILLFA